MRALLLSALALRSPLGKVLPEVDGARSGVGQ